METVDAMIARDLPQATTDEEKREVVRRVLLAHGQSAHPEVVDAILASRQGGDLVELPENEVQS